jgi:hypothetical protein
MSLSPDKKPDSIGTIIIKILAFPIRFVLRIIVSAVISWQLTSLSFHILSSFATKAPPLQWLNWLDVKRISGKSTTEVLVLLLVLAHPQGPLECRFREIDEQRRLKRFLPPLLKRVPEQTFPMRHLEVVFFEFRLKSSGRRRRVEKPVEETKTLWQPARA